MIILPFDNHPSLVSTTVDEVPDPPVPSASPLGYGHIPLLFAEGAVQKRIQGELFEQAQIAPPTDHAHKGHIEIVGQGG